RPNWANYTTTTLWNTLLATTLRLSDAHATLSEIYGKHMLQRLADMVEDANRLYKQHPVANKIFLSLESWESKLLEHDSHNAQ
ncbi:hypothetical protein ACTXT7_014803, partial [Hymenolepis weldensis]